MSDPSRATGTAELVLEPQTRTFAERRWWLGALAIPVLTLASYVAVVRLAALEQMLVADASHVSRAVLYELPKGSALVAPIEPGTQIIRIAMHAYRFGDEIPLGKRRARLHVVAHGDRQTREEDVTVDVPGQRTRVTSDEPGLAVGDPVGVDFDVHDLGAGELTVNLTDVDQADGLLVRMYRREELSPSKASARGNVLDGIRKNHLARWTWELAWDDASPGEQEAILEDRWRRVGALRGNGHDLRSIAVALVPRAAEARVPHVDDSLGSVALRGDERLAFVLHEGSAVRVTSDQSTKLLASLSDGRSGEKTLEGPGELSIAGSLAGDQAVEIGADHDVVVEVRSVDPLGVEWFGVTPAWRATATRPVVVESPEADRLLRVSVRRVVDREETHATTVEAVVEVTTAGSFPLRRTMRATRLRSRFDRYEGFDPPVAPTERYAFYVRIPRGGRASIAPPGTELLDVSLAELDVGKRPEPLAARGLDETPSAVELEGNAAWGGFVVRRPSNASSFDAASNPLVRVARHYVPTDAARAPASIVSFTRSGGSPVAYADRSFEPVVSKWKGVLGTARPALVPLRLIGEVGTELELRVVATTPPKEVRAGIFDRVTLPRIVTIGSGPTRAGLMIGDDVPPGPIALEVTVRPVAPVQDAEAPKLALPTLIHLPWVARHAAPHSTAPRWIAGQFEE